MDLSYSSEQTQLKDSVDRFVKQNYALESRRKLAASDEGFSRDHWKTYAELGWLGVALPEEFGGIGGSSVETMIIMEGIGQGLVLEPYLQTVVLGGSAILAGGSKEQKAELLPAIAEGKLLLAFAQAEKQSRFDLHDVELKATKAGKVWSLGGHKAVVHFAAAADKIVVVGRTRGKSRDTDGITLFLVDGKAKGLTRRDYRTIDGLRASELTFDGVAADVLGEVDAGLPLLEKVVDNGIAAVCAEAVGAMHVLHDTTLEYLKTRQQFGRPLGSFQVLQHRMTDMFMAYEQSRSMAMMVNLKLDESDVERKKAASAAKVQIGKAGRFVGQQSVQLHGGMGMTDELNVGHYFKRLTMIDTQFGNTDWHLERFGRL
jgi:alkylation response protein AidB-like acyl-CoA dehydrogenase